MSLGEVILAGLFAVFLLIIVPVYIRQGRLHGAVGWPLVIGGQVFLGLGGGDLFAWAGLAALFVSGFGLLLILMDIIFTRQRRKRSARGHIRSEREDE